MMGSSRATYLAVAALSLLPPTPAFGQTSLHAQAQASAGYSDNAFGAPDAPRPGDPERVSSIYFLVTPGAVLYHDTPRARYTANYRRSFAFYLETPENNNAADTLSFAGNFDVTPIDTLGLSISAAHSSFALLALGAAGSDAGSVQPDGRVRALTITVAQNWSHAFSQAWSATQGAGVGFSAPLDTPNPLPWTYSAQLSGGLRYTHKRDAHSLTLSSAVLWATYSEDAIKPDPDSRVSVASLSYSWTRDLSIMWSSTLSTGASLVLDAQNDTTIMPPMGAAILSYHHDTYPASFGVSRTPQVNLGVGRIFFNDRAFANVSTVLSDRLDLSTSATGSIGRNRSLGPTGNIEGVNVASGTLALNWPTGPLAWSLSYSHFRQFGETADSLVYRNMTRNVVLLSVGGMFPDRRMSYVPAAPSIVTSAAPGQTLAPRETTE